MLVRAMTGFAAGRPIASEVDVAVLLHEWKLEVPDGGHIVEARGINMPGLCEVVGVATAMRVEEDQGRR